VTVGDTEVGTGETPARDPRTQARWYGHATVIIAYLLLALFVYRGLWTGIISHGDGYLIGSDQDQTQWEWFSRSPRKPSATARTRC